MTGWALVAAVTCAVWAPTIGYDWARNWDDGMFFMFNGMIRDWSWTWMLTTQYYGHWMPLTWLSATLDYHLWGMHPWGWHAVNVALHTISAVLVYQIGRALIGDSWGAGFAALLWAIHPLRIESVAWITERKDVLMGVFFLSAALLWIRGRRRWAFVAFLLACMSKVPAITLPFMLLAYEWWRVRTVLEKYPLATMRLRFWAWLWRDQRALLPFFAVVPILVTTGFLSLATQYATLPWSVYPLGSRLWQVAYSEVFYARQMLWPSRLSGLIEWTWRPSWTQVEYPLAVGAVLLFVAFALRTWRGYPALTASVVCYTVAVLPQSGLFQNGPQLVANRYSYLACLPLALLAGGCVTQLARREVGRPDAAYPVVFVWPRLTVALCVAVLVACVIRTEGALPMWRDGDAMWLYAAAHEPTCTQCQDLASGVAYRHGDLVETLRYQRQAMRVSDTTLSPRWERHWNLGALLAQMGRRDEARRELRLYLDSVSEDRRDTDATREHIASATLALQKLGGVND